MLQQEIQPEAEVGSKQSQQQASGRGDPDRIGDRQEKERHHHHHEGQPGGLLSQVGSGIAPHQWQWLQQQGREPPQQIVLLEGIHHPHHRELAHHECRQEVSGEGLGADAGRGTGRSTAPEREHQQGHDSGEGPEQNLGPEFEHQRVLTDEQGSGNAQGGGQGRAPTLAPTREGPEKMLAHGCSMLPCRKSRPMMSSIGGSRTSRSRTGKSASRRPTTVVRRSRSTSNRTSRPLHDSSSP